LAQAIDQVFPVTDFTSTSLLMSFFGGFSGCKCSGNDSADPAKDTVKFAMENRDIEDKENVAPRVSKDDIELAAAAAKEAQDLERAEAEAQYQRELEESRRQAEADERQRQLEEDARLRREMEEAEERRRAEEFRKAAEEAETQRLAQEAQEKRLRDEREAQEAAEKMKKIGDFLARHGYATVDTKRKGKFGRYKFPLHTAVKHDVDIVPLMLEAGANPANKNSAGKTPYEYTKQIKSPAETVLQAYIA